MKPKIIIDLSIVVETVVRLDPEKPDEIDEQVRMLVDLLTDLKSLIEGRT
ncbi:hypothetical protein ACKFKF_01085 [Phormidesmis sp. 146-12]